MDFMVHHNTFVVPTTLSEPKFGVEVESSTHWTPSIDSESIEDLEPKIPDS